MAWDRKAPIANCKIGNGFFAFRAGGHREGFALMAMELERQEIETIWKR